MIAPVLMIALAGCGEIREVLGSESLDGSGTPGTSEGTSEGSGTTAEAASTTSHTEDIDDSTGTTASPPATTGGPSVDSYCMGDEGVMPLIIPDDGTPLESMLDIPPGHSASSVAIAVRIRHSWVSDLRVEVEAGGPPIRLLESPMCDVANIDAIFEDGAGLIGNEQCGKGSAIVGVVEPLDSLDPLMGVSGPWTLRVVDQSARNAGTLDNWCVVLTP